MQLTRVVVPAGKAPIKSKAFASVVLLLSLSSLSFLLLMLGIQVEVVAREANIGHARQALPGPCRDI